MKLFCFTLLFSVVSHAGQIDALQIKNLVSDDEGTKVVAENSQKKPVVFYLSQSSDRFEVLNIKLQKAQMAQKPVLIKTTKGSVNSILDVEEKQ